MKISGRAGIGQRRVAQRRGIGVHGGREGEGRHGGGGGEARLVATECECALDGEESQSRVSIHLQMRARTRNWHLQDIHHIVSRNAPLTLHSFL